MQFGQDSYAITQLCYNICINEQVLQNDWIRMLGYIVNGYVRMSFVH